MSHTGSVSLLLVPELALQALARFVSITTMMVLGHGLTAPPGHEFVAHGQFCFSYISTKHFYSSALQDLHTVAEDYTGMP